MVLPLLLNCYIYDGESWKIKVKKYSNNKDVNSNSVLVIALNL